MKKLLLIIALATGMMSCNKEKKDETKLVSTKMTVGEVYKVFSIDLVAEFEAKYGATARTSPQGGKKPKKEDQITVTESSDSLCLTVTPLFGALKRDFECHLAYPNFGGIQTTPVNFVLINSSGGYVGVDFSSWYQASWTPNFVSTHTLAVSGEMFQRYWETNINNDLHLTAVKAGTPL